MNPVASSLRRPIEGEEIAQSWSLSLLAFVLLLAGLAAFGFGTFAGSAAGRNNAQEAGVPIRWVLGLAGTGTFAWGLVQLVRVWRRNERLRIGRDRLQLLQGAGTVVGEIPYGNIVDIVLKPMPRKNWLLMLRLDDPGRKDTEWPQPAGFGDFLRQTNGCDVLICHETGFALSQPVIYDKLVVRWQTYRKAHC
jgi:hypothetical protein